MHLVSRPRYISTTDDISEDATISLHLLEDHDNFISSLQQVGYAIASLVKPDKDETDYFATDCITTQKSLISLFSPTFAMKNVIHVGEDNEWLSDAVDTYNFIAATIHVVDYHRIVLIKISGVWYLIESYSEEYTLKVTDVNAYTLLSKLDSNMYEDLFGPVDRKGYARIDVKFGMYDHNYKLRFSLMLRERINVY